MGEALYLDLLLAGLYTEKESEEGWERECSKLEVVVKEDAETRTCSLTPCRSCWNSRETR